MDAKQNKIFSIMEDVPELDTDPRISVGAEPEAEHPFNKLGGHSQHTLNAFLQVQPRQKLTQRVENKMRDSNTLEK